MVPAFLDRHRLVQTVVVPNRTGIVSSHIMQGPLVGVLAAGLILVVREEKVLSDDWVCV